MGGTKYVAVKRLNYPRISGIQTEAPRRGPSNRGSKGSERECGGLAVGSSTYRGVWQRVRARARAHVHARGVLEKRRETSRF